MIVCLKLFFVVVNSRRFVWNGLRFYNIYGALICIIFLYCADFLVKPWGLEFITFGSEKCISLKISTPPFYFLFLECYYLEDGPTKTENRCLIFLYLFSHFSLYPLGAFQDLITQSFSLAFHSHIIFQYYEICFIYLMWSYFGAVPSSVWLKILDFFTVSLCSMHRLNVHQPIIFHFKCCTDLLKCLNNAFPLLKLSSIILLHVQ